MKQNNVQQILYLTREKKKYLEHLLIPNNNLVTEPYSILT